jgi:hypothetical protein
MYNFNEILEELRPSQARRRGFESHHPLHSTKLASKSVFNGARGGY